MKKRTLLALILLLITISFPLKVHADANAPFENILFEKFLLNNNALNSIWHYEDSYKNTLNLTLSDIVYESDIVSQISFKGIYESTNSDGTNYSTNLKLLFTLKDFNIEVEAYSYDLNTSYTWTIPSFIDMDIHELSLNIPCIFSNLYLKYINTPSMNVSNYTPTILENSPVVFSIENDVPVEWFRYNASPEDPYYANCINHVSLMMIDWLYPEGSIFYFRPLNIFNINDTLTDDSLDEIVDTYSQYNTYSSKKITESILIENLKKGSIAIIQIDPSIMPITPNSIGNYYSSAPHYVILKGYSETDTLKYFSIFNPFTSTSTPLDDYTLGMNRIYKSSDIITSVQSLNSNVYIIKGRKKLSKQ